MNVLLISANRLAAPYPVYPLGLDYVAASISKKHNVRIIDMNIVQNNENLSTEISSFNPDVVGISHRTVAGGWIRRIARVADGHPGDVDHGQGRSDERNASQNGQPDGGDNGKFHGDYKGLTPLLYPPLPPSREKSNYFF